MAFDVVQEERRAFAQELLFKTESRVFPTSRRTDLFGTADVIVAGRFADGSYGTTLIDLKYGKNVAVPATTPQLGIYLMGAASLTGLPVSVFRAVIVQPRLRFATRDKVLRYDRDMKEMLEFSRHLHDAAAKTDDPNAEPIEGEHCRWCKAKDVCPAYNSAHAGSNRDARDFGFAFD